MNVHVHSVRFNLIKALFIGIMVCILCNVSLGRTLGYNFIDERKSTTITFQLIDNLIIIPVKINDGTTLKFILDTGMRTPVLFSRPLAENLDLSFERALIFSGAGAKVVVKGFVTNNVDLEFAGIIGTGLSMIVLEEDYLEMDKFPIEVHGVFGYGLLSRFVTDINYQHKMITFHEPETYYPEPAMSRFSLELHDTKPYINASIHLSENQIVETKLLIDTGAGTGLVLHSSNNHELKAPKKSKKRFLGRGLCGSINARVSKIAGLQFENYMISPVQAAFTDSYSYLLGQLTNDAKGSVGGDILKNFNRIIFDYPRKKVYLDSFPNSTITVSSQKEELPHQK